MLSYSLCEGDNYTRPPLPFLKVVLCRVDTQMISKQRVSVPSLKLICFFFLLPSFVTPV